MKLLRKIAEMHYGTEQGEQFFCCVVEDMQPICAEQCNFCKDWVKEAEELAPQIQ